MTGRIDYDVNLDSYEYLQRICLVDPLDLVDWEQEEDYVF